jgi:hypothetical protein
MTKLFDPIQYYDQGGSGYGAMKECTDGDYVKIEDYDAVKAEVLKFLENVLTGGWQYVENGDMFTDATNLKKKLQS